MFWDFLVAVWLFYCGFVYLIGLGIYIDDVDSKRPSMGLLLYIILPILLPIIIGMILSIEDEKSNIVNKLENNKS